MLHSLNNVIASLNQLKLLYWNAELTDDFIKIGDEGQQVPFIRTRGSIHPG